jgi:tetratricopeptide (TPR) repeat protein
MLGFLLWVLLAPGAALAAAPAPVEDKGDKLPDRPPAWLPGYRFRYPLRVVGDIATSKSKSIFARLPTGGWLKPDGSDVAVQTAAGQVVAVAVISHDPAGDTLIQFPRNANDRWYWAYVGNAAAAPAKGERIPEGLTLELRDWVGEDLSGWPAVLAGLKKSERVIGDALVGTAIHNCNPARPDDPSKFTASYRGYLDIKKAGVYRFFANADDASFVFIDGFKVFEQTGTNTRKVGNLPIKSLGAEVELKDGIHPIEVHHVMGNHPSALGYCTLIWIQPGDKTWAFVPSTAFVPSLYAEVSGLEEAARAQAACFVWGIDDAIVSGGNTIYLTRFEAQGNITDATKLQWDFGDGGRAAGRSVEHVYFKNGAYTVTLRSSDSVIFKRTLYVWATPAPTSPFSLGRTLRAFGASDWTRLDLARLNQMFEFLLSCEQPERWPLLERVSRHLLAQQDIDLQLRSVLYSALMESLAEQGKAKEGLALAEPALKEFAKLPSLRVGIRLTTALIHARHLKDPGEASKIYQAIVEEHRRLDYPGVRVAAVRWGDLYADAGDLGKAAEAYRLAVTLGGDKFKNTAQSEAITRGAQLRIAEQRLRGGDVRQTRQLLERIELDYPEQKLSGLYRFLRAEADRFAGRYEEAIRNYEVVLKLTQWAGYHDRATHGIADSYARMGELDKALKWLGNLQESHPRYYEKQKLADYRKVLDGRLKRLKAAGSTTASVFFQGCHLTFEPDEKQPKPESTFFQTVPSMGIDGAHTSLTVTWPVALTHSAHHHFPVANLQADGYYWVEFWYRGTCESSNLGHIVTPLGDLGIYYEETKVRPDGGSLSLGLDRSYGMWRKFAGKLRAPAVEQGKVYVQISYAQGIYEIDGLTIRPLSDRQNDTLQNFIERPDQP